jgi:hypothetical protein
MVIAIILIVILGCFALVTVFGAPYVPTLQHQTSQALLLLNLQPGQTFIDLGCGDGRLMLAAAKLGIKTEGYEINPIMYLTARIVTFRYRHLARVHYANYLLAKWPECHGIYVFSMDKYMSQLNKKLVQYMGKNIKLVSYASRLPGQKPVKRLEALYLYII